jgi:hypothetical protein
MSLQLSLALTTNAISLPGSVAGHSPLGSPDGPTIAPCGPVAHPANLSARQAKGRGLLTSGTYGQRSFGSSASVALRQSLVSRLHQRMASDGGMLFRLTWKERVTPSGRAIFALRASGRPTSGNGFGSWPTPDAGAIGTTDSKWTERREAAAEKHGNNGFGLTLGQAVTMVAGWPTATARDWRSESESTGAHRGPHGSVPDTLTSQSRLAGWSTPQVHDVTTRGNTEADHHHKPHDLSNEALLAAPGPTPTGSPAPTARRGQLNPAHSRWLMGYPPAWDDCAVTATPSSRKSRRGSSQPRKSASAQQRRE